MCMFHSICHQNLPKDLTDDVIVGQPLHLHTAQVCKTVIICIWLGSFSLIAHICSTLETGGECEALCGVNCIIQWN